MTTKSWSGFMLVNTTFIIKEIFINGESSCNRSVFNKFFFYVAWRYRVACSNWFLFIFTVFGRVSRLAWFRTFWINLFNITTARFRSRNVMFTLWHGIRITCRCISHLATSYDTCAFEPRPWSSNLSTITSHWKAL